MTSTVKNARCIEYQAGFTPEAQVQHTQHPTAQSTRSSTVSHSVELPPKQLPLRTAAAATTEAAQMARAGQGFP